MAPSRKLFVARREPAFKKKKFKKKIFSFKKKKKKKTGKGSTLLN